MNVHEIQIPARAGRIEIRDLAVEWTHGKERFRAIEHIDLDIASGEFLCLLGPSGCGKSTLLSALAGHIPVVNGRLELDGEAIRGPSPERGLVFQQHTLFPWKKVAGNVAFGLKMKGVGKVERERRAHDLLQLVGLSGFEQKYPLQLSGGMQQRVEIARALINEPRVLLMDEPFGALDAQTRWTMQQLLLEVWASIRTTIVFVTHDIDEALFLADRVLVMSRRPGRIREDIAIPAGRPRGEAWVTSEEFIRLKRHCLDLMHDHGRNGAAPAPHEANAPDVFRNPAQPAFPGASLPALRPA
jgi:NitT/TauT family transport system ATP-binding protein